MSQTQPAPPVQGEKGNTSPSPVKEIKRISASRNWTFTFFVETKDEWLQFSKNFKEKDKFIYGFEICPETKRFHLQGYVEFHKKCRPMELIKDIFPHWEKARGTRSQNLVYCSKDGEIQVQGFNLATDMERELVDPLEDKHLRPFQQWIVDLCKTPCKPNDRRIYWVYDNGNTGKSALCKHLCITNNCIVMSGNAHDIKHGIAEHIKNKKQLNVCCFHYTRSIEKFVSYEALESIKDGMFFSGKYEGSMVLFNTPHVFVFANFPPEKEKMTSDRWSIITNWTPSAKELKDQIGTILKKSVAGPPKGATPTQFRTTDGIRITKELPSDECLFGKHVSFDEGAKVISPVWFDNEEERNNHIKAQAHLRRANFLNSSVIKTKRKADYQRRVYQILTHHQ